MIAAGIGMRPDCGAEELAALVARAAALAGCAPVVLAVPHFRAGSNAPAVVAGALALAVRVVDGAALARAQPNCATRSARALAATGHGSVAEGCALAAAGPGARLLLRRIASANATCAIARGDDGGGGGAA